ncbi:DsrE/DsrF-like family protein [Bacillus sp. THAF10]|uniref:DsrE family protein n=1 Tax=Bacillus sp. THAF10 TaxID=2587848 RepID=UPI001268CB7F|nr:DsrE family protein [Bacillus sp. THAF10]QFT88355.1 DsrE/DsrF-like family protein [Bacillus sp. THAF10]
MKNKVVLVSSNRLGNGDEALGEGVLETFFTILKQQDEKPQAIFLMNTGVFTLTEESYVSVHLKEIHEAGVPVYACKTCVDHYQVEEKLISGEISGMGHFIELASKHEVLTIS